MIIKNKRIKKLIMSIKTWGAFVLDQKIDYFFYY